MLVSIKFFLYPKIIKFMRQFYGKGKLLKGTVQVSEVMRTTYFTFTQPNFDAVLTTLARCLQRRIFDWGFKKMWIMIFFVFC